MFSTVDRQPQNVHILGLYPITAHTHEGGTELFVNVTYEYPSFDTHFLTKT